MVERDTFRVALLLAVLACSAVTLAQKMQTLSGSRDVVLMKNSITAHLSKDQSSKVVRDALASDQQLLEEAAHDVINAFKRDGYSRNDGVKALAWGWYSLRVGGDRVPIAEKLSVNLIRQTAEKLSKLDVISHPKEADIFVDEIKWLHRTDAEGYANVGSRHVRVQKSGLEPAEQTCEIQRGIPTTFKATLRVSGSHAKCEVGAKGQQPEM
ncbi:MAG: hypothetical protein ABFD89_04215 [Bryobacteraceae bacterium]